jgi:2-polyprenyl-3-methyl-5-hydroxy-6-metoxy-1,4-benzoquinol methylase
MSDKPPDYSRFMNLRYDDFRKMACDQTLSKYEKIGFPDTYRANYEADIFLDICSKLSPLDQENQRILDIGPGCSDLPHMLIKLCAERGHELVLIDSREMLDQLPDGRFHKIAGQFPNECTEFIHKQGGTFDAIIVYSVLHYVMPGGDLIAFLDRLCYLLAPQGVLLIGDIPNVSMRKRLLASETGVRFHREFTGSKDSPECTFNVLEFDQIDDAVVLGMMLRARSAGFHAFVLPQRASLPMANRREDLLIQRP